jgi:hypothetical protein
MTINIVAGKFAGSVDVMDVNACKPPADVPINISLCIYPPGSSSPEGPLASVRWRTRAPNNQKKSYKFSMV